MKRRWKERRSRAVLFLLIPLVVLIDQFTKILVLRSGIVTTCNSGFAFGIFAFSNLFSTVLTILTLCVVGYLFSQLKRAEQRIGLLMVLGGGSANLVDRFVRGCVIDFVDFKIWPSQTWLSSSLTRWPSFNLADSAITIGVAILLVGLLRNFKNKQSFSSE